MGEYCKVELDTPSGVLVCRFPEEGHPPVHEYVTPAGVVRVKAEVGGGAESVAGNVLERFVSAVERIAAAQQINAAVNDARFRFDQVRHATKLEFDQAKIRLEQERQVFFAETVKQQGKAVSASVDVAAAQKDMAKSVRPPREPWQQGGD